MKSNERHRASNMNESQIRSLTEYYLHSYPERKNLKISDPKEITAGWETKLYKYTVDYFLGDKSVSEQHVIRVFSDYATSKSVKEFQVMMKLRDQGYPVPAVFHNELGGDVLGKPFIIMEYLPGNTMDHRFHVVSDSEREELYKQMVELFVDLHKVNVSQVFPDNKLSDTEEYISSFLNAIDERVAQIQFFWVNPVAEWLKERRNDLETEELCVIHGDFHGRNIMYREDGTPVVIDWSGAHAGDYRFDLAWTLILFSTFGGSFFRDLLLNLYSDVSGKVIHDVEYFEVLGCLFRIIHVFSAFLNIDDETGVVSKSEAMTPDISDHFHKVYDLLVRRTGIRLPEFEKIMSN